MVTGLEIAPTAAPTTVSLGGIVAEKVRITFQNKTGSTNASIFEITCTTGEVDAVDRKSLLEAYKALDAIVTTDSDKALLKAEKLAELKPLLMDTKADADTVLSYVAFVYEAIEEVNHVCSGGTATCQKRAVCSDCGREYGSLAPHTEIVIPAVAPTCTEAGLTEGKKCSACGITTVEQITAPATDHSYGAVVTEPTCTAGGYTTYTCTACGESYVDNQTAPLGHTRVTLEGKMPTCTEPGLDSGAKCSTCGTVFDPQEEIPALGHNYAGTETLAPTCTEKGIMTYVCQNDASHTYTEEIAANGHSYNSVVTAPDCENGGYTTHTCSVCNDTYTDSATNALGHTSETVSAKAPTCTETGLTDGAICSVCGDTLVPQAEIPANGHTDEDPKDFVCDVCEEDLCTEHNEATIAGKAATCTESGLTDGKQCSICGEILLAQQVIPANGHSYNYVVTAPDCVNGGYTTYTCSVCGDTYVADETAALGHSYDAVVTAPDCVNGGYTTCTCSVCGDTYVADETAALGHSYDDVVTAPDCVNGGYTTYACSVCGDTYVADDTAALGHSYDAVVTAPDCVNGGYTTYTCSVCGDTYVADETAALGHTNSDPVIENANDNSCTTDGSYDRVVYCAVCQTEISRENSVVPATGHSYDAIVTEPDCENGGYTTYICSVCDDTYVADEIDALGHDWLDATTEAPKTCQNCGATEGDKLPEPDTDPEDKPDETPDEDITESKDHSACEPKTEWDNFWLAIINFFRALFGLPEQCYCGEEIV